MTWRRCIRRFMLQYVLIPLPRNQKSNHPRNTRGLLLFWWTFDINCAVPWKKITINIAWPWKKHPKPKYHKYHHVKTLLNYLTSKTALLCFILHSRSCTKLVCCAVWFVPHDIGLTCCIIVAISVIFFYQACVYVVYFLSNLIVCFTGTICGSWHMRKGKPSWLSDCKHSTLPLMRMMMSRHITSGIWVRICRSFLSIHATVVLFWT